MTPPGCALPGAPCWETPRGSAAVRGETIPGSFPDPPHHLARNAIHHAPNVEIRKRIGAKLRPVWNANPLARAETAWPS